MAMSILNNSATAMALGETNKNTNKLGKTLKKVSSGMKINSAGDSAAEYSISEHMKCLIRTLGQNIDNVISGEKLLNIAMEGVNNQINIIKSAREIAIKSSNGIYTDVDRKNMQKEVNILLQESDDIANTTTFNGINLLNSDTENDIETENVLSSIDNNDEVRKEKKITYKFFSYGNASPNANVSGIIPSYINNNISFSGIHCYSTARYDEIPYDKSGNLNMWLASGNPCVGIPSAGTFVKYFREGEPNSIVTFPSDGMLYQDQLSGELRIQHIGLSKNLNLESSVQLDLSHIKTNGLPLDEALDNQGISLFCTECYQATSIHFTNELSLGETRRYSESNGVFTTYLIGVNGATNYKEVEDAVFSGIFSVNGARETSDDELWLTNYESGGYSTVVHTLGLKKYNYNGENVYCLTKEKVSLDLCVYQGIIGSIKVENEEVESEENNEDKKCNKNINDIFAIQTGGKSSNFIKLQMFDTTNIKLFSKNDYSMKNLLSDSVCTQSNALKFLPILDYAIKYLLEVNTTLGSQYLKLEYCKTNIDISMLNTISAKSVIRDADMAKEMTEYTKYNVLAQASQAMLAQSNKNADSTLSLLQ